MNTFSEGQVEAQNIVSLFGHNIIDSEIIDEVIEMSQADDLEEAVQMREDIFSPKIASAEVSLETGFIILADQIQELRNKMKRTSCYLTDLENLLT